MKYAKWYIFNFIYMTVINLVSRDLGLVSTEYTLQDLNLKSDAGFFDKVGYVFEVIIDNINSVVQFLSLQTELPYILNLFFVSPIIVGNIIVIIVVIRGN